MTPFGGSPRGYVSPVTGQYRFTNIFGPKSNMFCNPGGSPRGVPHTPNLGYFRGCQVGVIFGVVTHPGVCNMSLGVISTS